MKDISKDSILITLDVKALYSNISNHEVAQAVKETPNDQAKKPIQTPIQIIFKFLYLILTLNNFAYSGINYLSGVLMSFFSIFP